MAGSDDSSEFEKVLQELEAEIREDSTPATQGLPQDFFANPDATRTYDAAALETTETFPDNEFGRNAETGKVRSLTDDDGELGSTEPTDVFRRTPEEAARARDALADAIFAEEDLEAETRFFERLYASEAETHDQNQEPRIDDVVAGIYRVESILKKGVAYAVLHMGVHEKFELRLLPELVAGSPEEAEIRDASRRASVLGHDNLGFVTDIGFSPRFGPFTVGELIRGESLERIVERGEQLDLEEALLFVRQIGGALGAMHEVGLTHGLRDCDAIVRTRLGHWKLTRPGFPGTENSVHQAPEVHRGEPVTPASDQYALASILYALLVGVPPEEEAAFTPSELRSDLPEEIDAVILTALSQKPHARLPTIEEFREGIQRAVQIWMTPTVAPIDAREASRILQQAAVLKPRSFKIEEPRPKSVLVRIEDLETQALEVEMSFQNAARLRREYRRNILAAGLFIPMVDPPTPPQTVSLTIHFVPTQASVTVGASLVSRTSGAENSPSGAGLVFSADQHEDVLEFLRGLNLGLGVRPTDVIQVKHVLSAQDDLSPGEAFLMSRLSAEMTVGAARGAFTGLPFDFDDALSSLLEREFIGTTSKIPRPERKPANISLRPQGRAARESVHTALSTQEFNKLRAAREAKKQEPRGPKAGAAPEPSNQGPRASSVRAASGPGGRSTSKNTSQDELFVSPEVGGHTFASEPLGLEMSLASASVAFERFHLSEEDEERILEVVDYFEEKKNYVSAIDVLERSLEQDTKRPRLHHRLAVLRARFQNNLVQAVNSINRAIRLDPKNSEFRDTRRYIKSLQDIEAARPIYQQSLPTADLRFLRVDPDLQRLWVEVSTTIPTKERRIFAVDYQRRRLHAVTSARKPATMFAVPGNHPRLLAFDRKVPTHMKTIRNRRLKLLEVARAASDYGPWFREGSRALAHTSSSNYLVVAEIPDKFERGLYLVNAAGSSQEFRLDPGFSRSHSPCFSVDETLVAWVTVKPERAVWIAPCLQAAKKVFEPESDAAIGWGVEGLCVLEKETGKVVVCTRRGPLRELTHLGQATDGFVMDPEHLRGLFYAPQGDSTLLTWVMLDNGKTLSTTTVPYHLKELVVREDGLAFGVMDEGCVGIDMKRKRHHALTDVRIAPGSIARNTWQVGEPLIVISDAPETLEVLALNVRLLVNS